MVIRKADITDYDTVADFSKKAFLYHVENRSDILRNAPELSKKEFKKILKNKNWLIFLAQKDEKVVGHCKALIREVADECWSPMKMIFIYEMYVSPSYARQGTASRLLEEIKTTAKNIGASQVELDVWSFNEAAINLYSKAGFTPQRIKMELKL